MLRPTGVPASILITVGLTVGLAGCGADPAPAPEIGASAGAVATTPAATPMTSPATAPKTTPAMGSSSGQSAHPTGKPALNQHLVCPKGGSAEVADVQAAVDQGHQPWWLSPQDVAASCTFGLPDSTVEKVGTNTYRVTQVSSGAKVIVSETQPGRTGSTGIWAVTKVTPAP